MVPFVNREPFPAAALCPAHRPNRATVRPATVRVPILVVCTYLNFCRSKNGLGRHSMMCAYTVLLFMRASAAAVT